MKTILLFIGVLLVVPFSVEYGLEKPFSDNSGPQNITFQYNNISINNLSIYFRTNYSYDKIASLSWAIMANQPNYSYSLFCFHNLNHSITVYRFTCAKECDSLIEFSMFVNHCQIYIWFFDAYEGAINATLVFDMNVTLVYEGGPIRDPFDPPVPEPVPEPAPDLIKPAMNHWIIFAIVLSCVVFITAAGVGGWFLWRKRRAIYL
jgi:hypothetical protein